jgi:hypothetical protein
MPGRTWVIAPDRESLERRWDKLIAETNKSRKEILFHPHGSEEEPGDRHTGKILYEGLPGHEHRALSIANDKGKVITPIHYGFRSFDRQSIIPDIRLLNRPNPTLWDHHSQKQIYLTAPHDRTPTSGPALSFTALIPDLHHYHGRGGRVFPLWANKSGTQSNVHSGVIATLGEVYKTSVSPEDVVAYVAAVAASPAYVTRFASDLVQPGLHIPITANLKLFAEAVAIGREVVWLHTFGERFVSTKDGRPAGAPRLPTGERPEIPEAGTISSDTLPDAITYAPKERRLHVGSGYVDNVPPAVWSYEVSGKHVLTQWFSYRQRNRSRPIMGDRRPPSPLGDIQPDGWLSEYTTELLNVLNVLGRLVKLELMQADLLKRICDGPTVSNADLQEGITKFGTLASPRKPARRRSQRQGELLA